MNWAALFYHILAIHSYINNMIKQNKGITVQNLIVNSKWTPGPTGGPQYFPVFGPITYDKLSINDYRTCSITITTPGYSQDYYDPFINVREKTLYILSI